MFDRMSVVRRGSGAAASSHRELIPVSAIPVDQ